MRKVILLVVLVIIAMVCVGFAGMYTFTKAVYNEKGCDWANIDHIEMRTGSDIPPTIARNCDYNSVSNTRTARFELDMNQLDVISFVKNNGYQKLQSNQQMSVSDFIKGDFTDAELGKLQLYFRSDNRQDHSYRMLFDAASGELLVAIQYKK